MKLLLTITAIAGGIVGLMLATMPSFIVSIIPGTPFTDPGAILVGRITGAALISIAVACWLSRSETPSSVMVKVMLAYNILCLALLVYAALLQRISGPGLWAAVLTHTGLVAWCLSSLWKQGDGLPKSSKMKAILNPSELERGLNEPVKESAPVVDMTNAGKSKYQYKSLPNASSKK